MKELIPEIFSQGSLLGVGVALLFVGALFWNFRSIYKKRLSLRNSYAEKLHADHEDERAQKVDADTGIILRRVPIYGRVLFAIGVVAILAGIFAPR